MKKMIKYGSVCYSEKDGFWVQSKNSIINPEKDNAPTALMAYDNQKHWMSIIRDLIISYNIDFTNKTIVLYYEQCGGNIQKKSAVSGLDKMAIISAYFKLYDTESGEYIMLPTVYSNGTTAKSVENGIYNIRDYKEYFTHRITKL